MLHFEILLLDGEAAVRGPRHLFTHVVRHRVIRAPIHAFSARQHGAVGEADQHAFDGKPAVSGFIGWFRRRAAGCAPCEGKPFGRRRRSLDDAGRARSLAAGHDAGLVGDTRPGLGSHWRRRRENQKPKRRQVRPTSASPWLLRFPYPACGRRAIPLLRRPSDEFRSLHARLPSPERRIVAVQLGIRGPAPIKAGAAEVRTGSNRREPRYQTIGFPQLPQERTLPLRSRHAFTNCRGAFNDSHNDGLLNGSRTDIAAKFRKVVVRKRRRPETYPDARTLSSGTKLLSLHSQRRDSASRGRARTWPFGLG